MTNRWIGLPKGLRDKLPAETERQTRMEECVLQALSAAGYRRTETPVLEAYDLFTRADLPLRQEAMLKLEDRQGRLCVLRPDSTLPMARVAATRMKNDEKPLRISYAQPVFRVGPDGKLTQIQQAGAECFGAAGLAADAELLRLALSALRGLGVEKPQLEIGHAGLLPVLLPSLGLSGEDGAALEQSLLTRNFAVLTGLLRQCPNHPLAAAFSDLILPPEDGDGWAAAADFPHDAARTLLTELKAAADLLPGEDVQPDGAMTAPMGYYTGLMFKIYAPGAPYEVAVGGRYDGLMAKIGEDCPSVGFVLDMDVLSELELKL